MDGTRPSKRQKLSPEPADEHKDGSSSSDDEAMLADSVWASLGTDEPPAPPAVVEELVTPAADEGAATEADEDDFTHLLDLGEPELSTTTAASTSAAPAPDFDALLSSIAAAGKTAESEPTLSLDLPDFSALLGGADAGGMETAAPVGEDATAMALQNLQAMLAGIGEGTEGDGDGPLVEDAMMLSDEEEDEVVGSGDEMALDEEIASDDDDIPPPPTFRCSVCSVEYPTQDQLSQHLHSHVPNRAFLCDGCSKSFSRQDALKRHALGPSATNECQETQLNPNPNAAAEAVEAHERLLQLSLEGSRSQEPVKAAPPAPTPARGKKAAATTTTTATKKGKQPVAVPTAVVPQAPPKLKPRPEEAPEYAIQPDLQDVKPPEPDPDLERLQPGIAAMQAAHVAAILARLPPNVKTVEEAIRLSGISGEQIALLHFAFSEICRHQVCTVSALDGGLELMSSGQREFMAAFAFR